MDRPQPQPAPRRYRPISVGRCHSQTATDRFGDGARAAIRDRERVAMHMQPEGEPPFTWPYQNQYEDTDAATASRSIYGRIPAMQKCRNNLTALSRVYNLYFVAYQGRIFVYQPRSAPGQTLPPEPDLQLVPRPSQVARLTGGYLDSRRPHTINHIITGLLGEDEIVLACYDDGDVVAYNVREIASRIFNRCNEGSTTIAPGAFFHDNVGQSAWGLAIHGKSRLIAVSSNRHEMTVFAFGMRQQSPAAPNPILARHPEVELEVVAAPRNWRIILVLGMKADNLPNIGFMDGKDGYAEKVCGVDIQGSLWMVDIFKRCQDPIFVRTVGNSRTRSEEFPGMPSRGWGVLALPEHSFLEVETPGELFGMDKDDVEDWAQGERPVAFTGNSLRDIPGNPCPMQASRRSRDAMPLFQDAQFLQEALNEQNIQAFEDAQNNFDSDSDSDGLSTASNEAQVNDNVSLPSFVMSLLHSTVPIGNLVHYTHPPAMHLEGDSEAEDADDGDEGTIIDSQMLSAFLNAVPAGGSFHISANSFSIAPLQPPGVIRSKFKPEKSSGDLNVALHEVDQSYRTVNDLLQQQGRDAPSQKGNGTTDGPYLGMSYFPHLGRFARTPWEAKKFLQFLRRPQFVRPRFSLLPRNTKDRALRSRRHADPRIHILRTYEKDVELLNFYRDRETKVSEYDCICQGVTNFGLFQDEGLRHHFHATSRLNMIAHVPELYIIVVGSPTGRVAIITPTKKIQPKMQSHGYWMHGFRVEWILPTKEDEEVHRRTLRPLHGMAVGPVPESDETGKQRGASLPRRYRLMLHYQNHDILSYELTREEQTGKVCIF